VLPIGGVKEKVLAAHRAGIHTVIIPKANEPQYIADVSDELRGKVRIVLAERLDDVLGVALLPARRGSAARRA
jgi:ATP-dependent Lon protease